MKNKEGLTGVRLNRRRNMVEAVSSVGLIFVAAGLLVPFAAVDNNTLCVVMRYVFSCGALMFAIARVVNVNAPGDSLRLRRLRRMEMWAGFCFIFAAAFWFYNSARYPMFPFSLPVMRDTVAFTMAGSIIQVVASWMITSRMKKEAKR